MSDQINISEILEEVGKQGVGTINALLAPGKITTIGNLHKNNGKGKGVEHINLIMPSAPQAQETLVVVNTVKVVGDPQCSVEVERIIRRRANRKKPSSLAEPTTEKDLAERRAKRIEAEEKRLINMALSFNAAYSLFLPPS